MRLRPQELQEEDPQAQKTRTEALKGGRLGELDGLLHHQGMFYVPKNTRTKLISRHHNDPLAWHFGIEKTLGHLLTQRRSYDRGCDVCLASKVVKHKPYDDLRLLPIPTHRWKNLMIDLVTILPISTD